MQIPGVPAIILGRSGSGQAGRRAGAALALALVGAPLSACGAASESPPAIPSPVPLGLAPWGTLAISQPSAAELSDPTALLTPNPSPELALEALDLPASPTPLPAEVASPSPSPAVSPSPPGPVIEPAVAPAAQAVAADAVSHQIAGTHHVYQKWNNCAPSAAVMLLSVFGLAQDQLIAAASLKPDSQDTNVAPEEIAAYLRAQGLEARVLIGLDLETLKRLLRADLPVIAEQWIDVAGRGQMGHYRLITGYDDAAGALTMQDSYYGGNRPISYPTFENEWRPFNGNAVLAYRPEQAPVATEALGPLADEPQALQSALQRQTAQAQAGGDALTWFALAELRSRLGDHPGAVEAAESALSMGLPPRALWYQFGAYRSLYEIGNFERLLQLTDQTLAFMGGKNLEESHYWRGMALRRLGREDEARASWQAALQFHPGYGLAEEALAGP